MPSVSLQISEICRIVQTVQLGGGQVHSFPPAGRDYLVLFDHPESRTTLALPMSEMCEAAVREKIASVRCSVADRHISL